MAFRLDHIQLAVPADQEASCRAFWGDVLGLAELEKPEQLRARGGVWFDLGGAELHLGVETLFAPAKKAHPCFAVADLKAIATALERAGIPVSWDTAIRGRNRFFTEDPFGNRLEFMEG